LPDDPAEVVLIAARLVDDGPSVERVPSFAGNRVFRATAPSGVTYFKFGARQDIAREHAAIRAALGAGVPVPRVVALDVEDALSPHPLIVLEQVNGRPCDGSEPTFQAGISDVMARLHAVTFEGYGTATVISTADGATLRGESDTWPEALHIRAASAAAAADAGLVPSQLVHRVVDAVATIGETLYREEGRFLHGDFHPRHVYASEQAITAVIDWGDAASGDPDYDLARVLHAGILRGDIHRAVTAATALLPERERDLGGARFTKLLLYAAVFVCSSMAGELEGGAPWPPWWPAQTNALTQIVTAFDGQTGR
jgi:aminoglycoside phosphotransferase (APT) family kinase protein